MALIDVAEQIAGGVTREVTIRQTGLPSGGVDGDAIITGHAAAPGVYFRTSGVWVLIMRGVVTGQSGTVIGSDAIAFSDSTWVLTSILPAANVDRVDLRVDFPPVRNLYHISLTQLRTLSAAVAGGNVSESNSVPLSRTWFYDRAYNLSVGLAATGAIALAYDGDLTGYAGFDVVAIQE